MHGEMSEPHCFERRGSYVLDWQGRAWQKTADLKEWEKCTKDDLRYWRRAFEAPAFPVWYWNGTEWVTDPGEALCGGK